MIRFEDQLRRALYAARVSPYHGRAILQLCEEERRRSFIAGLKAAGERRPSASGYRKPSAVQAGVMQKAERPR
jgi:hypothetical protein